MEEHLSAAATTHLHKAHHLEADDGEHAGHEVQDETTDEEEGNHLPEAHVLLRRFHRHIIHGLVNELGEVIRAEQLRGDGVAHLRGGVLSSLGGHVEHVHGHLRTAKAAHLGVNSLVRVGLVGLHEHDIGVGELLEHVVRVSHLLVHLASGAPGGGKVHVNGLTLTEGLSHELRAPLLPYLLLLTRQGRVSKGADEQNTGKSTQNPALDGGIAVAPVANSPETGQVAGQGDEKAHRSGCHRHIHVHGQHVGGAGIERNENVRLGCTGNVGEGQQRSDGEQTQQAAVNVVRHVGVLTFLCGGGSSAGCGTTEVYIHRGELAVKGENALELRQLLAYQLLIEGGVQGVGVIVTGQGEGVTCGRLLQRLLGNRGNGVVLREEVGLLNAVHTVDDELHSLSRLGGRYGSGRFAQHLYAGLLIGPVCCFRSVTGAELDRSGLRLSRVAAHVVTGLGGALYGELSLLRGIALGRHFPYNHDALIRITRAELTDYTMRGLKIRPFYLKALGGFQGCGHGLTHGARIAPVCVVGISHLAIERHVEALTCLVRRDAGFCRYGVEILLLLGAGREAEPESTAATTSVTER